MQVDLGNKAPKIFLNSYPKSGTHLMEQILKGVPYKKSVLWITSERIDERGVNPGEIIVRHTDYERMLATYLQANGIKTFFLYRDLRDICVSDTFYITDIIKEQHPYFEYYMHDLKSFDERLMATIKRIDGFKHYLDWMYEPDVFTLRYEDLVIKEKVDASLLKIISFLWESLKQLGLTKEEIMREMKNRMVPEKSKTFRSGKTGEWNKLFKDEHKAKFKEIAGDLLIQIGYEKTNDW